MLEKTTDWSFSSSYKGTIAPLKQSMEQIIREFVLPQEVKGKIESELPEIDEFITSLDKSAEVPEMPVHMLG